MTVRNRLGVKRGLELATGLTGAIDEFSAREEEMEKDRRSGKFQAKRALAKGREKEEELLEKAIAVADERDAEARGVVEARHAARAEWIEKAHIASKRLLSKRAEGEKGRTATDLQVQAVEEREQVRHG